MPIRIIDSSITDNGVGIVASTDTDLELTRTTVSGNGTGIIVQPPQELLGRFALALRETSADAHPETRTREAAEASGLLVWAKEHSVEVGALLVGLAAFAGQIGWL